MYVSICLKSWTCSNNYICDAGCRELAQIQISKQEIFLWVYNGIFRKQLNAVESIDGHTDRQTHAYSKIMGENVSTNWIQKIQNGNVSQSHKYLNNYTYYSSTYEGILYSGLFVLIKKLYEDRLYSSNTCQSIRRFCNKIETHLWPKYDANFRFILFFYLRLLLRFCLFTNIK